MAWQAPTGNSLKKLPHEPHEQPRKPRPEATAAARFAAFAVFRDINEPWCPEMVALPVGKFLMGSHESEKDREDDEFFGVYMTCTATSIGFRVARTLD